MSEADDEKAIFRRVDAFADWLIRHNLPFYAVMAYPREVGQFLRWQRARLRAGDADVSGAHYLASLTDDVIERRIEMATAAMACYRAFAGRGQSPPPVPPPPAPGAAGVVAPATHFGAGAAEEEAHHHAHQ